ncbi:glycosyltransferase [Corynebacterium gallinarum]|uniref:Glycosyltransferase n=1 Tax=Corynebacterium gallinarum TaxID=2762214 RepID=A0A8I0HIE4_9CORY|nr:glycosyltransferase [Corynebacterium gallinarum]MBD8029635.1 glycosyltransferase [Corynebacterium gallinarum]
MDKGGVQSFLMGILRNIDPDRFEFLFLCHGEKTWDHAQEVNALGGKIINIPSIKEVGVVRYVQKIRHIIREYDVQIVHAHLYLASSFALFAGWLERAPLRIMHSHSTRDELGASIPRQAYVSLSRSFIMAFSTLRIACGMDAGKAFFRNKDFQLVKNGINISEFEFSQSSRAIKRSYFGLDDNAPVLMHVGRFVEVKNHKFLITIFAKYLTLQPHAILLLIGDGPLQQGISDLAQRLSVERSIRFLGLRNDMSDLYSAADLLMLPSFSEGLPLTLLESQANGLPSLVSTGVPPEAQVVENLINFKSLQDPVDDWAKAIESSTFKRNIKGAQLLREAGYDAKDSAAFITEIYEKNL